MLPLGHVTELTPLAAVATTGTVQAARGALTEVSRTEAAHTPGWYIHTACGDTADGDTSRLFITGALLSHHSLPPQHAVHRLRHVVMDDHVIP